MNDILAMTVASTSTTTSSTGSSSGSYIFLFIIVMIALFYFMFLRPNQRRRMQTLRQARAFDVGDEVVASGMVGTVVGMADGEVDVEVADGVVLTFVQQAVQSKQSLTARSQGPGFLGRGGMGGALGQGSAGGPGEAPGSEVGGGGGSGQEPGGVSFDEGEQA